MNYLKRNNRMERIARILILCVAPCLLTIPVFCSSGEPSLSTSHDYCPILLFFIYASDTFIMTEDITYLTLHKDFTRLGEYKDALNLPIVVFLEESPPEFLA